VGQRVVKGEGGALELTEPELMYPGVVCTKDLVENLEPSLGSSNTRIVSHSREVESTLVTEGVLDSEHRILIKRFHFLESISESERLKEYQECLVGRRDQEIRSSAHSGSGALVLAPMSLACRTSCAKARLVKCE